jgi:hypothetical protein
MKDRFCKWHRYQRVKVVEVEVTVLDPKRKVEVVSCPVCDAPPDNERRHPYP